MNTETKALTFRLNEIMHERRMTVEDLARLSELSRPTIYSLRDGKASGVQFLTLAMLCRALDVEPGDLFERVPVAA